MPAGNAATATQDTAYLFWSGEGDPKACVADWQRSFRKLCSLAEVQNGHFHRFRDTAAVGWLAAGLSIEEVAALLGNSPNVVIKHYSPWVLEHQRILEAKVKASWGEAAPPAQPTAPTRLRLIRKDAPSAA